MGVAEYDPIPNRLYQSIQIGRYEDWGHAHKNDVLSLVNGILLIKILLYEYFVKYIVSKKEIVNDSY